MSAAPASLPRPPRCVLRVALAALLSAVPVTAGRGVDIPLLGFIYPASPVEALDLASRELARLALMRERPARTVVAIADGPDDTAEMARQLATLGAGAIVLARRQAALDVVLLPTPGTTLSWEGEETDASATRLAARLDTPVRLAGALGGLASRSGRLAVVATPEDDDWVEPFRAGMRLVNADAELLVEAPDDDPGVTADRLAERRADVVLTADTRRHMIEALAGRGLAVILLGGAPTVEPPDGVIASVTIDWLAFYRPVLRALDEGRTLPLSLSLGSHDGAVRLEGPFRALPPAAAAHFDRLRRELDARDDDRRPEPPPPSMAR